MSLGISYEDLKRKFYTLEKLNNLSKIFYDTEN